jgi:hypothetical protein
MANTNAPKGFIPVSNFAGSPYNGATRQYIHASGDTQAIFVGDIVTATGDSVLVNVGGAVQSFPIAAQAVTGGIQDGVCIGVDLVTRDSPIYAPASTQTVITVAIDPNMLLLCQDINSGTPLTPNAIGLNVDFSVGSNGSTITGLSGMVLDNTTEAATNTLDLKIIGQFQSPGNDLGTAAATGAAAGQWLVKLNRSRFANQVAGV